MKIFGITVCVDYSDRLAQTLALWRNGLDGGVVITSTRDQATQDLCSANGVPCFCTDVFYVGGAAFNKSGAIDQALAAIEGAPACLLWFVDPHEDEWYLLFDADVVPPADWRSRVEAAQPRSGNLYGASRRDSSGGAVRDTELAGFFQLFHMSDPAAADRPLLGSWHNASGYDSQFIRRWPLDRRVIIPGLELEHLGEPGQDWCGRGNAAAMLAMRTERARRGGYQHERIS
jgi:hypothetical protein